MRGRGREGEGEMRTEEFGIAIKNTDREATTRVGRLETSLRHLEPSMRKNEKRCKRSERRECSYKVKEEGVELVDLVEERSFLSSDVTVLQ